MAHGERCASDNSGSCSGAGEGYPSGGGPHHGPSHRIGRSMLALFRYPMDSRSLALGLCVVLAACGGDGGSNTPNPATAITSISGDAQSGRVGQPLANPIQVVVTTNGAPSAGTTVTWSTPAQGAVLAASSATDANGIASNSWTLGTVSGTQTAQAALTGASGSPVIFTATAFPDIPQSLSKVSADGQTGVIGTQLSFQAKVSDQFGNGVPGVDVSWAATGGAVSATSVPSDGSGVSTVSVTLAAPAGPVTITATADALAGSPLTFQATSTNAPPPTATISVANNSFTPSTLTVAVGTTVTWSWTATARDHNVSPDGTQPARSGNPVDGPHTYQFTFNTPGTFPYFCEVHGAPGGFGMAGVVIVQ